MAGRTRLKLFGNAWYLLAFAAGQVFAAEQLKTCDEARLPKWVKHKHAFVDMKINVYFGNGDFVVVMREEDNGTMPVAVVVTSYDGKRHCVVDPSRLTYEFRYTNDGTVSDGGVRPLAPGRFSMPIRKHPTDGLSVTVNHATLGSSTRAMFDPVVVWTIEQSGLNELYDLLHQIAKPGYDPLLEPSPPSLDAIGRTIGRAIEALDDDRLDEALTLVHEVKSGIEGLPGGARWEPAVESVDRIAGLIEARRNARAGG